MSGRWIYPEGEDRYWGDESEEVHECVFVEEQEPSGRLVLPPCIVCGCAAMDALEQLRRQVEEMGS